MKKFIIISFSFLLLASSCDSKTAYQPSTNSRPVTQPAYQSSINTSNPDEAQPEEPTTDNPYDDGTGHSAGYNWAEETGGNCDTGKTSFDEGCQEYYDQQDAHDNWENNN